MIQRGRQNGPVGVTQELGVESDHLHRESDLVCDALTGAVTTGEQFKVLDSIIIADAVNMVDGFFGAQGAANVLLHDVPVFENVLARGLPEVARDAKTNISVSRSRSGDASIGVTSLKTESSKNTAAFGAAKTSVRSFIERSVCAPDHGNVTTALNAGKFDTGFTIPFAAKSATRARAVHGVFTEDFPVAPKFSWSVGKGRVTPFTREMVNLYFSWAAVLGFVFSVAFRSTKLAVFAGACGKNNAAFSAVNLHTSFLRCMKWIYQHSTAGSMSQTVNGVR